jgi:hypothetical protein
MINRVAKQLGDLCLKLFENVPIDLGILADYLKAHILSELL